MNISTVNLLNLKIASTSYGQILKLIDKTINLDTKIYIFVAAAHLIVECQKNSYLLKKARQADLVVPDGMPLVWLCKLAGFPKTKRIYGPQLTKEICLLAKKNGFSVFILGGASGQSNRLKKRLEKNYPGIKIVGNIDTPNKKIGDDENLKILKKINMAKPNIVLVGLGCPYQEMWISKNIEHLKTNIVIGVGAAFNFITGDVKQAPKILQDAGLEWLFRLSQEPKRLLKRYTVTNMKFIFYVLKTWSF